MEKPVSHILVFLFLVQKWANCAAHAEPCKDLQGRTVDADHFYAPFKLRPCVECQCYDGGPIRCGPPICLGRVNCALPRWNTSNCCNKDCFERRQARYDQRFTSGERNFQAQPPFWMSSRPDGGGPVYSGADDSAFKFNAQRTNDDTQMPYGDENVTSVPATHTQNLPSPYYPILIGLISCAPVALCIICVNAVRKYFALRNQFPAGSFFPRRRRSPQVREGSDRSGQPSVFTEPPPSYKDLGSTKYRLSEDLPRYEDVIKHERSEPKFFATTSSAQFIPPERVNFAFSSVDESFVLPPEPAPAVFPTPSDANSPVPLTAAPPSRRPTVMPPGDDPREGIDNPAHES